MVNKTEFLTNQYIKEDYSLFQSRLGFEEFSVLVNSLELDYLGRFIRACYMYQKAMKLKSSEPDISMSLLCSTVESTQTHSNSVIFKDWLVANRLPQLEGKPKNELRKILESSYHEYLNSEFEREGAMHNFKRFLLKHCPNDLREPPIKVIPKFKEPVRQASFEESIEYIYSSFRSLFVHGGVPRLEMPPDYGNVVGRKLWDRYRNNGVIIEMTQVLDWFAKVVLESLWQWLVSKPNKQ